MPTTDRAEGRLKRIALLPIALSLLLCGCGRGYIRVGFAQSGHESDWRTLSQDYAEETFSKEKGFLLTVSDADNYPPYQISAVQDFIDRGYDYIVADPLPSGEWGELLSEAEKAGIGVILINRHIEGEDDYTAWYGPDYEAEGRAAGQEAISLAGADGALFVIEGTPGSEAGDGRKSGITEALSEAGLKISASAQGDFTIDGGRAAAAELSEDMKDHKGVLICMSDNMSLGAMKALDEAGISYGEGNDIRIVSFNAQYSGLKGVLDGSISVDVESSPEAVRHVADDLLKEEYAGSAPRLEGEHPNEVIIYTKDNVSKELVEGRR